MARVGWRITRSAATPTIAVGVSLHCSTGGPFSSLGDAAHQDEHAGALSLAGVFVSLCPQDEFAPSLPLPHLCVPDA
jgi:hypothetical protein